MSCVGLQIAASAAWENRVRQVFADVLFVQCPASTRIVRPTPTLAGTIRSAQLLRNSTLHCEDSGMSADLLRVFFADDDANIAEPAPRVDETISHTNLECCPTESAPMNEWQFSQLSSAQAIAQFINKVTGQMSGRGFPQKDIFSVRLSLEEALVNSLKHGHQFDSTKLIKVRYRVRHDDVLVKVKDQGPGFDAGRIPDPTAPENLERPSGRGVFLMRAYMTWIRFNKRGNGVTLCKYRSEVRR